MEQKKSQGDHVKGTGTAIALLILGISVLSPQLSAQSAPGLHSLGAEFPPGKGDPLPFDPLLFPPELSDKSAPVRRQNFWDHKGVFRREGFGSLLRLSRVA